MGDLALGVAPDFRAGALVVRERIVRVGELVEDDALALARHRARPGRARLPCRLPCGVSMQFGAEGAHGLAALDRQVLRHDQDHAGSRASPPPSPARCRCCRWSASISVSPGLMSPRASARRDHRQRRPVLHRAGRIVALQLGEDDVAACVVLAPGRRFSRTSGVLPTKSSRV